MINKTCKSSINLIFNIKTQETAFNKYTVNKLRGSNTVYLWIMLLNRLWKTISKHTGWLKNASCLSLEPDCFSESEKLTFWRYKVSTGQWSTIPLHHQSLRLITVISTREMPSYLHSYGLSGLLPVENGAGYKLWLQGVLLDGGFYWPALTGYDHIGVCTCMKTCKDPSQQTNNRLITLMSRFLGKVWLA